jgi:iron complex outermembrane receptor protein
MVFSRTASAIALACGCVFASAQTPARVDALPPSVLITADPLGSGLFELAAPASVIESTELRWRAQGSLGETVGQSPGVASTWFGPASSRPVIRGLDGDRIRVLSGSLGMLDASSLSFDHAVPIDPLAVTRIEIVRGAAALLYGGNAVGGLVNALTNRIPEAPFTGLRGSVEARAGGAEAERATAGLVEIGNGRLALHADGFWRAASDLRIPGFARSARQRDADAAAGNTVPQPTGRVPNTFARADGGSLGASLTFDSGFAGLAYTAHNTTYGSPAETNVAIDMKSERLDYGAEWRNPGGAITGVKWKGAHTDYAHREIDAGAVGTTFRNKGFETRVELAHAPVGPLRGVFGLHVGDTRFSALGDEAFVPTTRTRSHALFVYEEAQFGRLKLLGGVRHERTVLRSRGDPGLENFADPLAPVARFAADAARSFAGTSASLGAVVSLARAWTLSANLSRTERAPTHYELFANGPHVATGAYEVGNPGFGLEKSRSLDAGLKWRSGPHSAGVSAFTTRFDNFVTLVGTGQRRAGDGSFEDPLTPGTSTTGETELSNETVYRAVPARLRGLEFESRWRLGQPRGAVFLDLGFDLVTATNLASGDGLARIPPKRLRAAMNYVTERHQLRAEVLRAAAQRRVPAGELTTDGYTLVSVVATTRLRFGERQVTAWLRGTNLLDREARLATSFLRDSVPLGGRALTAGVRLDF